MCAMGFFLGIVIFYPSCTARRAVRSGSPICGHLCCNVSGGLAGHLLCLQAVTVLQFPPIRSLNLIDPAQRLQTPPGRCRVILFGAVTRRFGGEAVRGLRGQEGPVTLARFWLAICVHV